MNQTDLIDADRPWIKDPRDDLRSMQWNQTLFNPMGETAKLHFTRAWTFMFMGRILMYFIPVLAVAVLAVAGIDAGVLTRTVKIGVLSFPAMLLPFIVFVLITEYTSFVAHMRRLADANRPVFLAGLVLLPLILAMAGFVGGTMMGKQGYQARQDYVEAKATLRENPDDVTAKAAVEMGKKRGLEQRLRTERRRNIDPPTELEMAAGMGQGIAGLLWALASFPVMLWTLFYVARLPNQGQGKLYTGSERAPDIDGVAMAPLA